MEIKCNDENIGLNKIILPSKNRLKKCDKGIHEFKQTKPVQISETLFETKWNCVYCGVSINNR